MTPDVRTPGVTAGEPRPPAAPGIRVLLAAHQSLPVGGIGTIARGLAAHVPAAIAPYGALTVAMPEPDRRLEARVRGLGAAAAAARLWHEQVGLLRAARGVDLVHLCDLRPIVLSRTPFVITVHDVNFLDRPEWVPPGARLYKTRMLRAALHKRPAAIVCHSEHARDRLAHHFPDAPGGEARVIYPGVDPPAGEWTGAGDPPFLLTVGTILPRKNHLGLLRALRQARGRGLGLDWVVAGRPGPRSGAIVRALEAEPGVRLLGEVDDGELDRLYREALFVATPSASEGFGYPPLEAMARGTPTLTSSAASLPEVVGHAGPLLAPDDVGGWARALAWLADDAEARRELSAKGRARALSFSWRRTADSAVRLYRDVTG